MAIVINGSGTVTGLAVGGLPDGTVDDGTVASGIASSKLTGALPAISGASLTGLTSAQMPTGSVVQVVQGTVLSTQTLTSSATYVDAGISASITPTSSSNKILVTATLGGAMSLNNSGASAKAYLRIAKGSSTEVCVSRIASYDYGSSGSYIAVPAYLSRLDSPSTTSEITYKIQFMLEAGTDVRICFNDSDSQLILTEIVG